MKILRNIGFAVASLFALELIFWAYTTFITFIVNLIILNFSGVGLVIVWLIFGGLIFVFVAGIGNLMALGYYFVCKIGTHTGFMHGWTIAMVVTAVTYRSIQVWGWYLLVGGVGILAAIFITVNIVILGIVLCTMSAGRMDELGDRY